MDANELTAAVLGAVLAAVLLAVGLRWRRTFREGSGLPIWGFMRLEGITRDDAADNTSVTAVMHAELSCSVCGSRAECRARLAAGGGAVPPPNCPNAVILNDFGIAVEKARQ